MSTLFDDARPGENAHEFTVSEISGAVKRVIEGEFGRVRVRGEVGRVLLARSGHLYFDLKDDRTVLASVSWKGQVARLSVMPEEGMEVVATGKLTTFGPQSKYQLNVEDIAPAGMGALMAMLEKRRKALAAEGLFEADRKRPLPYLPEVIGVVTSPKGAVIRDILHRLRERFPRQVLIWPVTVQGEKSGAEVAAAIRGFNAIAPGGPVPRPDVLIVARGGGSVEDLWGFNDEAVVRATAEGEIPLISAVGHETDTTLIDHAADRRAPTPTAAAEMAVPVRADLSASVAGLEERRRRAVARQLDVRRQRLADLSRALGRPESLLSERQQKFDSVGPGLERGLRMTLQSRKSDLRAGKAGQFGAHLLRQGLDRRAERTARAMIALKAGLTRRTDRARGTLDALRLRPGSLTDKAARARERLDRAQGQLLRLLLQHLGDQRQRLTAISRMLGSLGYTETLKRGFAVVRDDTGKVISDTGAARRAARLEIEFADGRLSPDAPVRARKSKPEDTEDQGNLF